MIKRDLRGIAEGDEAFVGVIGKQAHRKDAPSAHRSTSVVSPGRMIDIDDPGALPELRRFIVSVGLDPSELTDDEVRARVTCAA